MANISVGDAIRTALREIGVLAAGEVGSNDDVGDGFLALNRMIDQWAAQRLTMYKVDQTNWTLVSGTQTYTIGPGGDVNIARPVYIDHIHFIDTTSTPPLEFTMQPYTDDSWSRVRIKELQAYFPTAYYYNATYPTGTLKLWPVPQASTLLGTIYSATAVTKFTALTDLIALPPGYEEAIIKNLALKVAPTYGRAVDPELKEQAKDAIGIVKRANKELIDMQLDTAIMFNDRRSGYFIRQG